MFGFGSLSVLFPYCLLGSSTGHTGQAIYSDFMYEGLNRRKPSHTTKPQTTHALVGLAGSSTMGGCCLRLPVATVSSLRGCYLTVEQEAYILNHGVIHIIAMRKESCPFPCFRHPERAG